MSKQWTFVGSSDLNTETLEEKERNKGFSRSSSRGCENIENTYFSRLLSGKIFHCEMRVNCS